MARHIVDRANGIQQAVTEIVEMQVAVVNRQFAPVNHPLKDAARPRVCGENDVP